VLREEIEELFAEAGAGFPAQAFITAYSRGAEDGGHALQFGLHVFGTRRPDRKCRRTALAREENSKTTLRRRDDKIRAAILAGERPASLAKKRGRPPTTWLRIAKELGVEL